MPNDLQSDGEGAEEVQAVAMIASLDSLAHRVDFDGIHCPVRWRIWGTGPRLILLHGNGGSWLHWFANIPELARSFQVMVPDIPGFGDSGLPPEPHDCRTLAAEIYASAASLIPEDESVAIVGFSMGASIAAMLAVELGSRLVSLVLIGAGRGFGLASTSPTLQRWRHHTGRAARRAAHSYNVQSLMVGPLKRAVPLAEEIQARGNEAIRARFRRDEYGNSLHTVLCQLACEIVAIWGEEDAVMQGHRDVRATYFRSAGAQVCFLPNAGHWAQFDVPETVNELLINALATSFANHVS